MFVYIIKAIIMKIVVAMIFNGSRVAPAVHKGVILSTKHVAIVIN